MRTVIRIIVTAAAVLTGISPVVAQSPEGIRQGGVMTVVDPSPGAPRSPLAVIERILSFDANNDLQISRDELPERMQGLIARGDKDGDAALDVAEIHALINAAASERTHVSFRPQSSDGLPGVISDLKLSPARRGQALEIVHNLAPNPNQLASAAVFRAIKSLLDDEEYENFAAAAVRLSKTGQFRMSAGGGGVGVLLPPRTVR